MQLIPLTEEGKAMLEEAAVAERERWLKYERARRTVRLLGVFLPNLMAATIYAKLEGEGYCWDSSAEQWVNSEVEARRQRSITSFMRDLNAGKFTEEGEDSEAQTKQRLPPKRKPPFDLRGVSAGKLSPLQLGEL